MFFDIWSFFDIEKELIRHCLVYRLGLVPYETGLKLQRGLVEERKSGNILDTLLLLEHPSIITLGKNATTQNILVSEELLEKEEIAVFRTERGGDVTYHGPGQIVGYPILNLKDNGLTVSRYVGKLEEIAIKTLANFGIEASRSARGRGIFVNRDKIGAIGLRITGGVSMHGFALNVNVNLKHFDYILPCGLDGVEVTSIAELLGQEIEMAKVQDVLLFHFAEEFGLTLEFGKEIDVLRA